MKGCLQVNYETEAAKEFDGKESQSGTNPEEEGKEKQPELD
jgi:hypothetical protein